MLAQALKAHAGLVLYRGFVYNQHLDWHDPKADRAKAGFDTFSHTKSVLRRPTHGEVPLVYPPYNGFKRWVLRRAL